MALIYNADLRPSKLELLTAWVGSQPWLDGADASQLEVVGAYRFDDPAGEVGVETHLVRTRDGRIVQVPLTYRAAPLDGADDALVGTMDHSVLGKRWTYDGCVDPVYVTALATTVLTGGRQADLEFEVDGRRERREGTTRVSGTGSRTSAPSAAGLAPVHDGPLTVLQVGDVELVLRRVLDGAFAEGTEQLTGVWPGNDAPVLLACVR